MKNCLNVRISNGKYQYLLSVIIGEDKVILE